MCALQIFIIIIIIIVDLINYELLFYFGCFSDPADSEIDMHVRLGQISKKWVITSEFSR